MLRLSSAFKVFCITWIVLFSATRLKAQYEDLSESVVQNFYYGTPAAPFDASMSPDKRSYSVSYTSSFEAHSYDMIVFEAGNTFFLNYWNDDWGNSIAANKLVILDYGYNQPFAHSEIRKLFHPDTILGKIIGGEVLAIKKELSKQFRLVSLQKKGFDYSAWQNNPGSNYSESFDIDNNGTPDIEISSVFSPGQQQMATFSREFDCSNSICNQSGFVQFTESYFLNATGTRYIRQQNAAPPFQTWTCSFPYNYTYQEVTMEIVVKVNLPEETQVGKITGSCIGGAEMVNIHSSLSPFQSSAVSEWKINGTPVPQTDLSRIAQNEISWTFPKNLLQQTGNKIEGVFKNKSLENLSIPLSDNVFSLNCGCPSVASYTITASCIGTPKITVNGLIRNFEPTSLSLNNTPSSAVQFTPTPTGTNFTLTFDFVNSVNAYKICFYNSKKDSLAQNILIGEIYEKCSAVIDACNGQPRSNTPKNRIEWITENQQITTDKEFVISASVYVSAIDPDVSNITLTDLAKDGFVEEDTMAGFRSFLPGQKAGQYVFKELVSLNPGTNRYRLSYSLDDGTTIQSRELVIIYRVSSNSVPPEANKTHDLWVFTFGVNDYESDKVRKLNYAVQDAMAIDSMFRHIGQNPDSSVYRNIHTLCMVNKDVTREKIIDSLQYYSNNLIAAGDFVLIYYSGHGKSHPLSKKFYFITYDCTPENYTTRGLSSSDLNDILGVNQYTYMLYIDACYSGSFTDDPPGKDLDQDQLAEQMANLNIAASSEVKGYVVLTAANSTQKAFESPVDGHGFLAIAIMMAFTNTPLVVERNNRKDIYYPDNDHNHILTINEINSFMMRSIKKLSSGRQQPWLKTFLPVDFPTAIVK